MRAKRYIVGLVAGLVLATGAGAAEKLAPELSDARRSTLALQIDLARVHASPGPLDGRTGKNTTFAVEAFQKMIGADKVTGELSDDQRAKLKEMAGDEPILRTYEISEDDTKGPFIEKIPGSFKEMAKLDAMSFTSVKELLAEKFQSYPELLDELNGKTDYTKAGTKIVVPNVQAIELAKEPKRIEVDREKSTVWVYGENDKLIAAYPATVGSTSTPSPSGKVEVKGVAPDPKYYYNPEELDFKGVKAKEQLIIPPGPNNPVGTMWIDLSKEGYGIHGTSEPTEIRRSASHGCVRLTNWDATTLGKAVSAGVPVTFVPLEEDGKSSDKSDESKDGAKEKDGGDKAK